MSAMLGGGKCKSRNSDNSYALASASQGSRDGSARREKAVETWESIKGALIGVAATRFTDYVGQIVPGFQEHFENEKHKTKTSA